jgi:outer membrane protein OmpA-like peptidoglycan-associated protein
VKKIYNQHLSLARANDVNIIENSLSKAVIDVKFELNGFGENENESPFEKKPEERSYNRTVIIDIVPTKK